MSIANSENVLTGRHLLSLQVSSFASRYLHRARFISVLHHTVPVTRGQQVSVVVKLADREICNPVPKECMN